MRWEAFTISRDGDEYRVEAYIRDRDEPVIEEENVGRVIVENAEVTHNDKLVLEPRHGNRWDLDITNERTVESMEEVKTIKLSRDRPPKAIPFEQV